MAQTTDDPFVRIGSVDDAKKDAPHVVTVDGQSIGIFHHEGSFHATDLRCPHMGFPLTDGTVEDGILTCPWHHARFELSCGDTLDPFADDVPVYPVEVRDGDLYVRPEPIRDLEPEAHWRNRLDHGLRENIGLIIAKAVIGLDAAAVDTTVPVETGVTFGARYRDAGWGPGLTTLGVMTNLLDVVDPADRPRALYTGLRTVASDCAGEPPFFTQAPLSVSGVSPDRLLRWFRDNIEVRDSDGAERVLRAAIQADFDQSTVADMFVAASTDHLYLDVGHRLDFINKAFETLEFIGWEHADTVLPSLIPGLATANRAEERASWRQPVDLAALCFDAAEHLPDLIDAREQTTWTEPVGFIDTLLGDDPDAIIETLTEAIATGASSVELAECVAFAAATRIAQFGTANEFNDWNTVHHTYSYANAVHGMARRSTTPLIYRGIFDASMSVYLDRFLNTPPQRLPDPDDDRDPDAVLEDLLRTFEVESDDVVNRAGRLVAEYLAADGDSVVLQAAIARALLREDAGFHTRQNLEAAFAQYRRAEDGTRADVHLIATARYLAAHTPTRRSGEQTYRIAERLNRGELIHEG